MTSLYFTHEFDSAVEHYDVGSSRYRYTVVFVPTEIIQELPVANYPRLRVSGEINDLPFDAALTPTHGRWYILFSKRVLTTIGAAVGDIVSIRFRVADQEAVDVPPLLAEALAQNEDLGASWNALTAGKQRSLAYLVSNAKTDATIRKRVAEAIAIVRGERELRTKSRA